MDSVPDTLALPGQKYVELDPDGVAMGFYAEGLQPDIPPHAMPIDDELWVRWSGMGKLARWADGRLLPIEQDNPPPPLPYLRTAAIWTRCSEDEAETLDALLAAQPVRVRRLFAGVAIQPDDEAYQPLRASLREALGPERADELLATG